MDSATDDGREEEEVEQLSAMEFAAANLLLCGLLLGSASVSGLSQECSMALQVMDKYISLN